jgi:hypothetical protein
MAGLCGVVEFKRLLESDTARIHHGALPSSVATVQASVLSLRLIHVAKFQRISKKCSHTHTYNTHKTHLCKILSPHAGVAAPKYPEKGRRSLAIGNVDMALVLESP